MKSSLEPRVGCIASTLGVLGDRWTCLILRDLTAGPQRFSALQKSLDGISPRTLSQRLELLVEHQIITKHAYAEMPPRVEYRLTTKGSDVVPILRAMADWGAKYS